MQHFVRNQHGELVKDYTLREIFALGEKFFYSFAVRIQIRIRIQHWESQKLS